MLMLFETIEKLASETGNPCITISLNTHRTHPDSMQDGILLKNLAAETERRLLEEYDKRDSAPLIRKLQFVLDTADHRYNLDSMHIFISSSTVRIVKLPRPAEEDRIYIDDRYAIRPLIDALNETEQYTIALLSQSGARLYEAQNDAIEREVENENFPIGENTFSVHPDLVSHARENDNKLREYLNHIDKALVREFNRTGYRTVVISTPDNYRLLQEVADRPEIYSAHSPLDYHRTAQHELAAQAWEPVGEIINNRRAAAISEIEEAISLNRVLTDLSEIYRAVVSGRGELLAVEASFTQAARIIDDMNLELLDDPETPGAYDDIVSYLAWKTIEAKGRAIFCVKNELGDLGPIVLKTRY